MANTTGCSVDLKKLKDLKESEGIGAIDTERLNQMLLLLVKRLFDDFEFRGFAGLDIIKAKVTLKTFKSTSAFMDDIRKLSIGETCSEDFNAKRKQSLDNLKEFVKQELNDISNCNFCYEKAVVKPDEWFSLVCPRRHPLAWAKVMGHPHAPAKVMKYNPNEKTYVVYFFGGHETAIIPSHYCLAFTEKSPNKILTLQQRKDLNTSMKEVFSYIDNLKTSGSFSYAVHREKFDQHTLFPRSEQNVTSTNNVTVPDVTPPLVSTPNGTCSTSVVDMTNSTDCISVPITILPAPTRSVSLSSENAITTSTKIDDFPISESIVKEPVSVNNDPRELFNKYLDETNSQLETSKLRLAAKDVLINKLKKRLTHKIKVVRELKRVREETDKRVDDMKKKSWCSDCQNELNNLSFCNADCTSNWGKRQKS